jgi:type II secretory pathway component PulC
MSKSEEKQFGFLEFLAVFLMLLTFCGSLQAEEIVYDSGKRRDPFIPLTGEDVSVSASSSGVRLEGIIYDPGSQSMAILNGKTYQVGEGVGDAKVLRILKDHVVISVDGEETTLWIRKEEKT